MLQRVATIEALRSTSEDPGDPIIVATPTARNVITLLPMAICYDRALRGLDANLNPQGPRVPDALLSIRRLRRTELPTDTNALARYLIGKSLVHEHRDGRLAGRIVETEAYVVGDAADHAFRGETPRNRSLFLTRGHAYVYFVYGCWFALNVSGETAGIGAGVLLRALEPTEGIAQMRARRGTQKLGDLARGPGRLATAMDIDRRFDGVDLCRHDRLWLGTAQRPVSAIGQSVRIGLSREIERKLRYFEYDSAFVSGPKRLRTEAACIRPTASAVRRER